MKNKKIILLLTTFLVLAFISACGPTSEQDDTKNDNQDKVTDVKDSNAQNKKETTENNGRNNPELTEDEVKEHVFNYIKENKPEIEDFLDNYQFMVKEKEDKYQVNMFSPQSDDEDIGSPPLSSYEVDQQTGAVEEVEYEPKQTERYISEITDFTEKERRAHHERLADRPPEQVKDKVYEHLMLPGVHENTQTYEGRINPGESVRFSYFDEEESQQFMDDPDVSEDGYFTMNLGPFDLKEGQEIEVAITGGYPEQQNFILTVNKAQEGMENIRVK